MCWTVSRRRSEPRSASANGKKSPKNGVDAFAEATDDHQFIHVNPELAAQTPYGGTIAHGFLTLSLSVVMGAEVDLDVGNPLMGVNYGPRQGQIPRPRSCGIEDQSTRGPR